MSDEEIGKSGGGHLPSPRGLSVLQQLEGPLDVHAVADPGHAQVYQVLFLQRGQVGALDLIVQESVPVLPQVQALQPVRHVVLAPQLHGFGGEGFARGRHRLQERERRRGPGAPAAAARGAQAVAAAAAHGRGGQAEDVREGGGHGRRQRGAGGEGGGGVWRAAGVRLGREAAGRGGGEGGGGGVVTHS